MRGSSSTGSAKEVFGPKVLGAAGARAVRHLEACHIWFWGLARSVDNDDAEAMDESGLLVDALSWAGRRDIRILNIDLSDLTVNDAAARTLRAAIDVLERRDIRINVHTSDNETLTRRAMPTVEPRPELVC